MEFTEILDYIFAPILAWNVWLHTIINKNRDNIRDNKEAININNINDKSQAAELEEIGKKIQSFADELKSINDTLIRLTSVVEHLEETKPKK
jgi:chromosome segregation ATPase